MYRKSIVSELTLSAIIDVVCLLDCSSKTKSYVHVGLQG